MGQIKQQLKSMMFAAGMALVTGLGGISSSVLAMTPDGETPANENVCDVLMADGITKGLYGLCVAYCEAQDLDMTNKKPPSIKILENYEKKRTKANNQNDPSMPCVQTPVSVCPCWSGDELASISDDGDASCEVVGADMITITNTSVIVVNELHFADADTGVGREQCRYIDFRAAPIRRIFEITPEEAAACYSQINAQTACQ